MNLFGLKAVTVLSGVSVSGDVRTESEVLFALGEVLFGAGGSGRT